MTQGISKQYYGRIIQFQWRSFPIVRQKAFELQAAEKALQDAVEANALEGEIDRLASLKKDAEIALAGARTNNEEVDYTVGYFESEEAFLEGKNPVLTTRYTGNTRPEHQEIYAKLAEALYEDIATKE